jgi:hypothetical protein
MFLDIDLLFRSICTQSPPYWDCKPLNEFKKGFPRFCASISAEARTRAPWRFKSAYNLFINMISKKPSLAPSYGSVSRETGNVPTSTQEQLIINLQRRIIHINLALFPTRGSRDSMGCCLSRRRRHCRQTWSAFECQCDEMTYFCVRFNESFSGRTFHPQIVVGEHKERSGSNV